MVRDPISVVGAVKPAPPARPADGQAALAVWHQRWSNWCLQEKGKALWPMRGHVWMAREPIPEAGTVKQRSTFSGSRDLVGKETTGYEQHSGRTFKPDDLATEGLSRRGGVVRPRRGESMERGPGCGTRHRRPNEHSPLAVARGGTGWGVLGCRT